MIRQKVYQLEQAQIKMKAEYVVLILFSPLCAPTWLLLTYSGARQL